MFKQFKLVASAVSSVLLLTTVTAWAATTLTGAGATFPYPIYSKWFDSYGNETGARINYQSIGSGAGIQQLKAKTVDFGASDAPLSNDEMKKMPGQVVHIPTVAGAVAVVYNITGVRKGLKLTPEILSGIYLGRIRRWDDSEIRRVNPRIDLPSQQIYVAHRSDGSGTSFIFTNYLADVSYDWKKGVGAGKSVSWPVGFGGKGNEGVAGIIKSTPGTIGYVELAYAVQNHLSYASVENSSGRFIEPDLDSTTAAVNGAVKALKRDVRSLIVNSSAKDAYPICGLTYILLYKNQPDASNGKELCRFLNWAMSDGQKMAKSLLYAPLPSSVAKMNNEAIDSIKY